MRRAAAIWRKLAERVPSSERTELHSASLDVIEQTAAAQFERATSSGH